ncbi:glycerophosphodiester phosphodiesterase [Corynebacterium choanae]|uniref:Putative glycerophosphoryl diester phosphodiesterase 1 n=1 Tax=Corynebacterium choanae TaxID=1862358 RepID=A0A3G6J3M0_9CORY|nr:glycerophosphodiester phosphodiesterase family protein [Corynebacterium choanae]AZA12519.1 putative glycerophosphoryl diester phosphodiesterase 1 [Corynebacterium choanae]
MRQALPKIVAHRGDSGIHCENSLQAFESAFASGADVVECDLRLSSGGTPIVFHDKTVDRMTRASGLVSDRRYRDFLALEYAADPTAQPLGLASLLALAAQFPDTEVFLETKSHPWQGSALEERIATVVHRSAIDPARLAVISFDPRSLRTMRRLAPAVRRVLLRRDWWPGRWPLPTAGCDLAGVGMSKETIADGKAPWPTAGLRYVWTANTAEDLTAALSAPVDYVATDYPARAMTIRQQLAAQNLAEQLPENHC